MPFMAARIAPGEPFPWDEADRMFTLLVRRAAELAHCRMGSPQEEEFDRLASAIEAYEEKRWPQGRKAAQRPSVVPQMPARAVRS